MSTRLILIELEEPSTADGIAKAVSVWELPSAEELGCAVLKAFVAHDSARDRGEAILRALRTAAPAPGKS